MKHVVPVLQNKRVGLNVYRMELLAPEIAFLAHPGQFLHVSCQKAGEHFYLLDPFLRRPLSVHEVDANRGTVALLYRVVGRGTALLVQKKQGELLDVLGPLGRGFTLPVTKSRLALVAGGMGVAPLFFLCKELLKRGNVVHFLVGGKRYEELCLLEMLRAMEKNPALKLAFATDDGSYGFPGPVTDLLEPLLARGVVDMVYACGPWGMLRETARLLGRYHVPGEVSLEERMGCGVGACLSCACKIKDEGQAFSYRRVCTEGPVFPVGDVVWEVG